MAERHATDLPPIPHDVLTLRSVPDTPYFGTIPTGRGLPGTQDARRCGCLACTHAAGL